MRRANPVTENFSRPMVIAFIVGVIAAAVGIAGYFMSGAQAFFQAYLFAFLFWVGVSLGLLVLLLLHFTVKTKWGLTIRRVAEAGAGSIWAFAILFIPIIIGMGSLYPWANPAVAASPAMQPKVWYLNVPGFIIRAIVYFVIWFLLAFFVNRGSAQLSRGGGDAEAVVKRLQGLGAFGMIVFAFTVSLASVDWLMSLTPEWVSTAFGVVIAMSYVLIAMSFAVLILNLFPSLSLGRKWNYLTTPVPYQDLGALMLTFVMAWAYVAYFQMLIQWAGNIPREVIYYLNRVSGGWNILAIFIAVFQFALPFMVLLSIRTRHNLKVLAGLGALLLFTNLVNMFWQIKPTFFPNQLTVGWLDIVMPIAVGGLFLGVFFWTLSRRPALNTEDQVALHLVGEQKEAVH